MTILAFLEEVLRFWNGWEVRSLVLLSLFLQIILIIFGSQRKHTRTIWIDVIVWLAYLTADWVATLALGTLARSRGDSEDKSSQSNTMLHLFWAPFLLLHLGGPDTITAYSLEDNELWLRHALELVVQVAVAFYIYIPSWNSNSVLRFLAIPVFVTGIIKCGERTLVLWSSSSSHLNDSLRSSPDPGGPAEDFHKLMEQLPVSSVQSTAVDIPDKSYDHPGNFVEESTAVVNESETTTTASTEQQGQVITAVEANLIADAFSLFTKFRCLYANQILDHRDRKESYTLITHWKSAEHAFKLVAIELGLMYDVLYTKAVVIYKSLLGVFLRCICLFSHVSVSVAVFFTIERHGFPVIDISITWILLLGSVILEVYALIMLFFSDWTKLWCHLMSGGIFSPNRWSWSGSMGQYNLLSFCLANFSAKPRKLQEVFGIKEKLDKYLYLDWNNVDVNLQELIFKEVKKKSEKIEGNLFDIDSCKELLGHRGDNALEQMGCLDKFQWSTIDVEFDHSLLLWHIATSLCYLKESSNIAENEIPREWKISRCVSDYMLYLLVVRSTMLPKGIGEIRYRDTCAQAMRFFRFKKFGKSTSESEVCKELFAVKTDDDALLEEVKRGRSLSVLFYGCKLAQQLQQKFQDDNAKKWEVISKVWIEMLGYAANHCGWKEHGQKLAKGGELLTHVCLLMAHLGLSEQYQIQRQEILQAQLEALQAAMYLRERQKIIQGHLKVLRAAIAFRIAAGERRTAFNKIRNVFRRRI